jgi:hypothetical protein
MLMARADLNQAPAERGLEDYPPDWLEDFHRLSDWVLDLSARYGDRVLIRIWDPRSMQGVWKSIRYGIRRYPTFIVAGRKVSGWDTRQLEQTLAQALGPVQA